MCMKNPNNANNWVCNIQNELFRLGLNDFWYLQESLNKEHLLVIKQRLYDTCKQELDAVLHVSPKCKLYQHLVSTVDLQTYLTKPIPNLYKKFITKIRLSAHNLAIEQGRYNNTDRNYRYCKFCMNDMEDETHFLLLCPLYDNFRCNLIKPYFWKKTSVFKVVQLLSTSNITQLCNLGKFIFRALKLREDCL